MKNIFSDILEKKVMVRGKEFTFSNRIGSNQARLDSFNHLFQTTFGMSFDTVGGDYEPHSLLIGDRVCANVSVNMMPMLYQGKNYLFIQLGSVMTDMEYRNQGLGGYLMQQICDRWRDRCDLLFLFGSDSVLEYYPKFGFIQKQEYEYSMPVSVNRSAAMQHLDMKLVENIELVRWHYAIPSTYSALSMIGNKAIFEYYYQAVLIKHVWYDQENDLVICMRKDGTTVVVYDILGICDLSLQEISERIASSFEDIHNVSFMFTPKDTKNLSVRIHKVEDCTFFAQGKLKDIFDQHQMMFAKNNHA